MKKSEGKLISRSLDGASTPEERVRMEKLMLEDPAAASAARRWQDIGDQLRVDASRVNAPDPTLAWHEIRREIRNLAPQQPSVDASMGRLRWVAALASISIVVILGWSALRLYPSSGGSQHAAAASVDRVEWVVAEVPGATTMIFSDEEAELTVIWMDLAVSADSRDS